MTTPNTEKAKIKVDHTLTPSRDAKTDIIAGAGDTSSIPDASNEESVSTNGEETSSKKDDRTTQ